MISLGLQRFTCFNRWASVDNAFYDGHLGIPTAISSETSAAHVSCAHRTCHTNRFRTGQMAFQKMKEFEVCSLSPFLVGGGWLPLVPSAEVVVSLSLRLQFFSDCLPEPSFHPSHFLLYNLKKNYHGSLPNTIYLSAIKNVSSTATRFPFCWPSNAHPLLSASARNNFRSKQSTGAFLRSPNIASDHQLFAHGSRQSGSARNKNNCKTALCIRVLVWKQHVSAAASRAASSSTTH